MKKEYLPLLKSVTALVQLCFLYLLLTWGYQLVHFVMTTIATPFLGGA